MSAGKKNKERRNELAGTGGGNVIKKSAPNTMTF